MPIDLLFRLLSRYGALAGCLAVVSTIWFFGPYIRFGETAPLESTSSRWIATLVVFLLWGLFQAVTWIIDKQRSEKLASTILESGGASSPEEIKRKFEAVLQGTRRLKHNGKPLRLQTMPWYLVIGPPGSGKTSALRASGLKFPARDVIGAEAVRGVGGTRNCSWWVTSEAVLVDTAGRYTTQLNSDGSDRIEWEAFLQILKANRPKQPINGLIVLVGAEAVCNSSDREFETHVTAISERVREASAHFGISLPIYLCISKMDRIPGFLEVFEDVPEGERRRALGVGLGSRDMERDPGQIALTTLQTWLRAIESRAQDRLSRERNRGRLEAILGFSASINSVGRRLSRLVSKVSNAGDGQSLVDVRGIYFLSALQTGEMVDRIAAAFGAGFAKAKDEDESSDSIGRAYFIEGLFRDVAFAEQALAGCNLNALTASNRRYRYAGLVTAGVVALLLALGTISYLRNRSLTVAANEMLPAVTDPAVLNAPLGLTALDAVSGVRSLVRPIADSVPFSYRMGLSQAPSLDGGSRDAFRVMVENGLARYLARLHESALVDPQFPAAARFEILKSYLMLAGLAKGRSDPNLVSASSEILVSRVPGVAAEDPPRAARHIAVALRENLTPVDVPDGLINRSREMFGADPLTLLGDLAVERTLSAFERSGLPAPPFSLADALGPHGSTVFEFDRTVQVPGFLTNAGAFYFDQQLARTSAELAGEVWVLGLDQVPPERAQPQIQAAAVQAYVTRYTEAWDRVLGAPRMIATDPSRMREFAQAVSGTGSPIERFLRAVGPHLAVSGLGVSTIGLGAATPTQASIGTDPPAESAAADRLRSSLGNETAQPIVQVANIAASGLIREHYRDLIGMIGGTTQPSLQQLGGVLGRMEAELGSVSNDELMVALGGGAANQAIGTLQSIRDMQSIAGQFPAPVQGWLSTALAGARQSVSQQAVSDAARDVSQQLSNACPADVFKKYPFARGSASDASLGEIGRVFGSGGFFDAFFQENLARNVDRNGARWRFINGRAFNGGIRGSELESFRLAQAFADRFGLGDAGGSFRFAVQVKRLSANAFAQVQIGATEFSYRHGRIPSLMAEWRTTADSLFKVKFSPAGPSGSESSVSINGPWALLRAIDRYGTPGTGDTLVLVIQDGGYELQIELQSRQLHDLFSNQDWRSIRCPG